MSNEKMSSVTDEQVTVYLNGTAHVQARAVVHPVEGRVELPSIASTYIPETLHPSLDSKHISVLESRLLPAMTFADIARSQIHQTGIGDAGKKLCGQLLNVEGDRAIIHGAGKIHSIPVDDLLLNFETSIPVPFEYRHVPAVELVLGGVEDGQTVQLSYLAEHITLTPNYRLVLLPDNQLTMTGEMHVKNQSGKAFTDVVLEVIPSEVHLPRVNRGGGRTRHDGYDGEFIGAFMAFGGGPGSGESGVFEEDGQTVFVLGKRNLPEGDARFGLFRTDAVEYEVKLRANLSGGRQSHTPSSVLSFTTPVPIECGQADVYSTRELGDRKYERFEGGNSIGPVAKGGKVELALKSPDTLEVKVERVEKALVESALLWDDESPVFALSETLAVTIRNAGAENVVIEGAVHLGTGESVELVQDASVILKEETDRDVRTLTDLLGVALREDRKDSREYQTWRIPVPAHGEVTFSYAKESAQMTALSREEIKRQLAMRGEVFVDRTDADADTPPLDEEEEADLEESGNDDLENPDRF